MADHEDDDVLELTDPLPSGEDGVDPNAEPLEGGDEEGGEFEVSFGDQVQPGNESDLIRHMRGVIKEKDAELAAIKRKPEAVEVGPKPTIEGCDYDEDRFATELEAWVGRKHQAEAQATAGKSDTADQEREDWNRAHQGYVQKRAALPFQDKEEVEAIALASLRDVQQAVIVKVAVDPAKLLYALGRNPAKLAEVSTITDPLKLAAAVARLEGGLKVMPKRRAPDPDREQRGSARVSPPGPDKHLERLEREAEKPGADRTELIRYKKKLKAQAA